MTSPAVPRSIDVSHLPTFAFGSRDPLWWGVIMLIAVESTMFVLLVASYLFVRSIQDAWPPTRIPDDARLFAFAGVAVLVVSSIVMERANRAAEHARIYVLRRNLVVATILGALFVALRFWELRLLDFRWTDHTYGSIFWTLQGLHVAEAIAGVLENVVFLALMFRGPLEEKHLVDAHVSSLFWHFVTVWSVVIVALLYLDPGVH